jgi:general secretion pathway protein J
MRRVRGFTLVEVLVAISVLSLLALMGWRGVETVLNTRAQVSHKTAQVAQWQTGLAQWRADLQAMTEMGSVPALDFDGLVLRITRVDRSLPGQPLRVVAWSRRVIADQHQGLGSWVRWQSPPLSKRSDLELAWVQAQRWARNPSQDDISGEVAIGGIDGWQLLYFRKNSWSNPLSTPDGGPAAPASARAPTVTTAPPLPEGIRLVLQVREKAGIQGTLTQDWARLTDGEARP